MSTRDYKNLKVTIEGELAFVVVDREKKLNALNSELLNELKELFAKHLPPLKLKGVVLTGAGEKAFIAGADISEMLGMEVSASEAFGQLGQEVTFLIENFLAPVIAVVDGFALGGGCEIAMSCDFIYCSKKSIFGQPEVKLGLIPGFGGTQRLAKYIGRNRAKELVYTGKNIDAQEALTLGLVNKVLNDKSSAIEEAQKTFDLIKQNSPLGVSTSKKVINQGCDLPLTDGLAKELEQFSTLFSSYDLKEGMGAFLEKRKAQFRGE